MSKPTNKRFSASRRQVLIGAGTGVMACAAAGGAWSYSERNRAHWIEQVIRSNLPGVKIDEASLALFVRKTLDSKPMQSTRRRLGIAADQQMSSFARRFNALEEGIEITERQVLTDFLIGSNFFRVSDPKQETIVYYGSVPACNNPCVRYS